MDKLQELLNELRHVLSGRGANWPDTLLPPLVFLVLQSRFDIRSALLGALTAAFLLAMYRLWVKTQWRYALGGFLGVFLAALFVAFSGSAAGFFIPGLFSGGLIVLACVVSLWKQRPLAAWSSYLTRRWPLDWYSHPRVLPAYREVTWFWAFAFTVRLGLETWLFARGNAAALGSFRLLLGWPYIILVLIVSYLYGQRRLAALGGPSVQEFKDKQPPPWTGQLRGF